MRIKGIIAGTAGIAVLAGTGLMMTAFLGKAKAFSTDTAAIRNISEDVSATGDVHGTESMTYYSAVTAPVSFYDLKVGDEIKAGDLIVGYDLEDLLNARDQAVLASKSAENTMNGQVQASNSNQAKFNKAASDIEIYRNTYALFRQASDYIDQGQYRENWDIGCIADGINKDLAQKTADLNTKTLELQNAQYEGNAKAIKDLTDQIENLNQDIADLNSDLAGLPPASLSPEEYAQYVLDGNWMSDIMRNWTEASTLRNTYENQILNSYQKEQLRNSYDLSALSVVTAEENLAKASTGVTAEYDGIVTESFIANGSVVSKGSPLFTVESSRDIKVDVGISKYDIGQIAVGQKAAINIAGNEYSGTVNEIKRLATATDSDKAKVTVSVKFDEPDEKVYIGLEADVTIRTSEKEGVLTVSSEGYYADDGGDYCYLIKDGKVEKQYITAGAQSDEYIEIRSGLSAGDVVITDAITDDMVGKNAVPMR
ncbi:MAG: efflux RND transporter periplasmic adaptor subunit [Lachnospiraceae bacterium]|nr:efflux RND transporter periplasmic adaptor subunit [Lachnospiraceae bacterium]